MAEGEIIEVDGVEVTITNPDKVLFPEGGWTKLDIARYYLAVAPGALRGCRDRPTLLRRFPNGIHEDSFYQKRVPTHRPPWIRTTTVRFPSGRSAEFITPYDVAHLLWIANLGCLEMNPWLVRADDVEHPDELRVDLDPTPGIPYADVRRVALEVRAVLEEHGLRGYPKTSGKRGMHILARIHPRWDFTEVRRAALALSREVERRMPETATTAWWKEEREGVFLDYNMNARDRTLASAYSIRPEPDGRVSCPLEWDEVSDVDPAAFTIETVPARFAERGDPHAGIDDENGDIEGLRALAERDERDGLGDAPWPPHFPKAKGEPRRVAPSKRAKPRARKRPED